ncbi:hypothetical protein HPP92_022635 [Vanilla planifolia]|uniref:Uncharacterized protein n=1 Tax=Vanilla planifolia TaxID=51239 RepID=A0A835UDQ7_VANPL|nr:hypothetical protein HPP92_022635 [Vanilla planifolia]
MQIGKRRMLEEAGNSFSATDVEAELASTPELEAAAAATAVAEGGRRYRKRVHELWEKRAKSVIL